MTEEEREFYDYTHEGVKQSILHCGLGLGLAEGWVELIAEKVASSMDKWVANKDIITETDIRKHVTNELVALSPDIAYAYENHDKII